MHESTNDVVTSSDHQVKEPRKNDSPFFDTLSSDTAKYASLSGQERIEFLKAHFNITDNSWNILNRYLWLYVDNSSSHFFGFEPDDNTLENPILSQCFKETGISAFLVIVRSLGKVTAEIDAIKANLTNVVQDKTYDQLGFPFRITKGGGFSVSSFGGGSELVFLGEDNFYKVAQAILSNDKNHLKALLISIETQFFHEQLHHLGSEDGLNTHLGEEMSLLGEFLYDPVNNTERSSIFTQMTEFSFHEAEAKTAGKWQERYDRAWQKVDIVILISELLKLGLISTDDTKELENLVGKLPTLYGQLTKEQRMSILTKYLPLEKERLHTACLQLATENNISLAA